MKRITGILRQNLTVLAVASLWLTGCSMWSNFTTYFNLYYNASEKFTAAEKQLLEQKKELFTLQEVKTTGTANQSFTSVIEKLSRLLQFKSQSAYVDDALLMIGKCFFYQQDYQKASRKFAELVTTFPESELVLESKLWLGKANFRLKNFEEGNKIFEEVKTAAEAEDENSILVNAYVEQISYYISIENYNDAISNIIKLTEVSEDDQKNALVTFELGKLYLKIEQHEEAAKAFVKVLEYSPDYKTEFDARLEYGKVQRELDKHEQALVVFEDLKSESLFNDFLDQTDLNIGLSLMNLNRLEEAFKQLTYVDTTYKGTPTSGIAVFHLGELMEKSGDLDSSFQYYKLASSSTAPQEYLDKAKKKVLVLSKYTTLDESIKNYYKQLVYIDDPERFIQDSLKFAEEQARLDSAAAEDSLAIRNDEQSQLLADASQEGERMGERQQQRNIQRNTPIQKPEIKRLPPVRPKISADSLHGLVSKAEYELGGLYFTDLHMPDSAYKYYSHILTEHKNSPYKARTLFALGSYYLTMADKVKADSLFEIVYSQFQNESIANAAAAQLNKPLIKLNYDPAEELYTLAEKDMLADKDSQAIVQFLDIFRSYPKSSFAPKALYTSGWLMENRIRNMDSAAVLYDSIVKKYPSSPYASAVRGKLDVYQAEQKKVLDSLKALAEMNKPKTGEDSVRTAADSSIVSPQDVMEQEEQMPELPAPVYSPLPNDSLRTRSPELTNPENPDTLVRKLRRK